MTANGMLAASCQIKVGFGTCRSPAWNFILCQMCQSVCVCNMKWLMRHLAGILQVVSLLALCASSQQLQCPFGYELTCQRAATNNASSNNNTMLAMHNAFRERHRAPALSWDSMLEADATQWARQCMFAHSGAAGQGENLYAISAAAPTASSMSMAVQTWYDEIKLYAFASPGFSAATGHATQLLWRATRRLGCAVQTCANGLNLGWGPVSQFVVCRYAPPGNVLNEFAQNVLPAAAAG